METTNDQTEMLLTKHIVSEVLANRMPNAGQECTMLKSLVLKAAERIEKYGHLQGWYHGGAEGPCCIMGALHLEFGLGPYRVSEVIPAVRWGAGLGVHPKQGGHAKDIMDWNDAPERTKDDVVGALRRAAGYL